jgi:hypothetical protein
VGYYHTGSNPVRTIFLNFKRKDMKSNKKSYNKEEIMKRFRELKATGKQFTLGDTLRDEDVDVVSFLQPYHDAAKQLSFVSEIIIVKTSIGVFTGFFVKGENIIFYHPDSLTVLIEKNGNDISEISVDEVEELFN